MALLYMVIKNHLNSSGEHPYISRTVSDGTISESQFIQDVSFGSTVTETDVEAVFNAAKRVLLKHLSDGRNVNTGFSHFSSQVKGHFVSLSDSFSKDKNWVDIKVNLPISLKNDLNSKPNVRKLTPNKQMPMLFELSNLSKDHVDTFSSGDLAGIEGVNLVFDKADLDTGIFLVNNATKAISKVQEYSLIKANRVHFKLQALDAGSYNLLCRIKVGEKLREGVLEETVTVI